MTGWKYHPDNPNWEENFNRELLYVRARKLIAGETLRERATTVFRKSGDTYTAVKTRNGDVIIGGKYDYNFVEAFAKATTNVYIEMGDE